MFCIGIDGGGSKLRIGIFSEIQECIFFKEISESANPSIIGFDKSEILINSSLEQTFKKTGIESSEVKYVGAGMAGAAHHPNWLRDLLSQSIPNANITIAPDYEIALIGAHGERFGVLIISGTGSVAFGINKDGESAHSGGWGYLLDDVGSGYWLGKEMLKSAARVADGLEEKTELFALTLNHLKISSPDDLITWIYNPERKNRNISEMAPIILKVAKTGDFVAQRIIEDGAEKLYQLYLNVIKRLKFNNPPVMFAGGILNSDTLLRRLLMKKIGMKLVPSPKFSPVAGAALMTKLKNKIH